MNKSLKKKAEEYFKKNDYIFRSFDYLDSEKAIYKGLVYKIIDDKCTKEEYRLIAYGLCSELQRYHSTWLLNKDAPGKFCKLKDEYDSLVRKYNSLYDLCNKHIEPAKPTDIKLDNYHGLPF